MRFLFRMRFLFGWYSFLGPRFVSSCLFFFMAQRPFTVAAVGGANWILGGGNPPMTPPPQRKQPAQRKQPPPPPAQAPPPRQPWPGPGPVNCSWNIMGRCHSPTEERNLQHIKALNGETEVRVDLEEQVQRLQHEVRRHAWRKTSSSCRPRWFWTWRS